MKPLEIIIGAVVLLISIVLIVICMMQEQKPQNATAALTGASNDSFYDKNRGRTKEARLKKITFVCSVILFVLILFMDIVMPELSGVEALKLIKTNSPDAVVIMATSVGTVGNLSEAIKLGANDFLQKPVDEEQLDKLLDNYFKKEA